MSRFVSHTLIFAVLCASISGGLFLPAHSQTVTFYYDVGYCEHDTNRNGILDFAELSNSQFLPLAASGVRFNIGPVVAGIPEFPTAPQVLYSMNIEVLSNGLVERNTTTVESMPHNFPASASGAVSTMNPFDDLVVQLPSGTAHVVDAASSTEAFVLGRGAKYTFDVDDRCQTGSSLQEHIEGASGVTSNPRTQVTVRDMQVLSEAVSVASGAGESFSYFHTQFDYASNQLRPGYSDDSISFDTSETDMVGFAFQGDTVIEATGDFVGNIVFIDTDDTGARNFFPETDGQAGDVTLTLQADSVVYGDVVFGNRDIADFDTDNPNSLNTEDEADSRRNAAVDVVFVNNGSVRNVDFRGTSNVTFTNNGSVGTPGGYGVDAQMVSTGIIINNSGSITNIDGSDTPIITINNEAGGSINGIRLNAADWQFDRTTDRDNPNDYGLTAFDTLDVRTVVNNAGALGTLTVDRNGQFDLLNSGTISSVHDTAISLSGLAAVDFVNTGTISANSSDTIDFRFYEGTMLLDNRSVIIASTNNTILADETEGDFTIQNSGTISNTNNRALSFRNFAGEELIFNNSGTFSSNQTTVAISTASSVNSIDVELNNLSGGRISANFGNAVDATSIDNLTLVNAGQITSNVIATLELFDVNTVDITNSGQITTNSMTAVNAVSATSFTLNNSGSISAFNRTMNVNELHGALDFENSGTIQASVTGSSADSDAAQNYVVDISRASGGSGNLSFTNTASGRLISAFDRAVGLRHFNETNDEIEFTNAGIISAVSGATVDLSNSRIDFIRNETGGSILAGRSTALLLTNVQAEDNSLSIENGGTISAGTEDADDSPAAIFGVLNSSVDAVSITNTASATNIGTISSVGGNSIFLDVRDADFSLSNSGTIIAGVVATDTVSETESSHAVRISNVEDNDVTITNSGTGIIRATGDTAISIAGGASNLETFTLRNLGESVISADNNVIVLPNIEDTVIEIENAGTIAATASDADHLLKFENISADFNLTNSGTISSAGSGAVHVDMRDTSVADEKVILNNNGGTITSDSQTVIIEEINEEIDFDNTGTISATAGASALSIRDIGDHPVDFTNGTNGNITASNNVAVHLAGFERDLTFTNGASTQISAANRTIVFVPSGSNSVLTFSNNGEISASSDAADHVVRLEGFSNLLSFENNSAGTISSGDTRAVFVNHTLGTPALDFDNLGEISSVNGETVRLNGFTDKVDINNSGSILSTGGANALTAWAGNETIFRNSGRIEADGNRAVHFNNFVFDAGTDAPSFTNTSTGRIQAAAETFLIDASGVTNQRYTFVNNGEIRADTGSHAVSISGVKSDFVSTGTIAAQASPAVLLGPESTITISGTVDTGGNAPIAFALEGTGTRITLQDGAVVLGDFDPLVTSPLPQEDRHQVILAAVSNASYYYKFETDYFRFFIINNDNQIDEKIDGEGFSPALSHYDAIPQMHIHHARNSREIWRQLNRFTGTGSSMRTFGFTDSLSADENEDRSFSLSGSRRGVAHSFQQSIFNLFDAEVILVSSDSAYDLDTDIFTLEQGYEAVGLGFSDFLAVGPFSLSAIWLNGLGETEVDRLVFTNTNDNGLFRLRSSYDSAFVDMVYEGLFDFKVYGPDDRLTRRRPFRFDMEVGLGGSIHNEINDDYTENYSTDGRMTVGNSSIYSAGVSARLKLDGAILTQFAERPFSISSEIEFTAFEITNDVAFSYAVDDEEALTYDANIGELTTVSASLGAMIVMDEDLFVNLSYTATTNNNDSDESSLKAAVKWRF